MTTHRLLCLMLLAAVAAPAPAADTQPPRMPAGYRIETIEPPRDVMFEVGGLAFTPKGDLLATTRAGQVWRYAGGKWSLFADGLAETLGVCVDPRTGDTFVAHRPELTQLIDTDADGRADVYKTVTAAWGLSGNYHEYAFGPVRDSKGNFYVTLNLSAGDGGNVQDSTMGHVVPYRGWCVQVTPDGKLVPFASGMRSPAGIAINQRDEVFYTDNQGDFNATSSLHHVVKGRFHGHPASLVDDPAWAGKDLDDVPQEQWAKLRTPPAVWIPYGELANSPGEPTFDLTEGKFGPFKGQIFLGDQTKANLMRVVLEKVGGEYQGCVFNFIGPTQCGIIRGAFAPDGSLYIGQTQRGWASLGSRPFGIQRVVYDGKTTPFEMHSISITPKGFTVRFTSPVKRDLALKPANYALKHWGYIYQAKYGSPKVSETVVTPTAVKLSQGGRAVELELPEVVAGCVYQITLSDSFMAADGAKPTTRTGYYTVNRLKK